MADNFHFGEDLKNFYLVTFALEQTIAKMNKEDGKSVEFPFNDEELSNHLEVMKEILADKFCAFCRNCVHGRTYISRAKAAELRPEFYKRERQELTRIQNYQESRPDLYD